MMMLHHQQSSLNPNNHYLKDWAFTCRTVIRSKISRISSPPCLPPQQFCTPHQKIHHHHHDEMSGAQRGFLLQLGEGVVQTIKYQDSNHQLSRFESTTIDTMTHS